MPVNPVDSQVFGTLYGSDAMRAVFDDRAYFQRLLDVESALARVQARLGIIPAEAASAISRGGEGRASGFLPACRQHAQCRLSCRWRGEGVEPSSGRGGTLDALGRHHPGHHGYRAGAADPRWPDADPPGADANCPRACQAGGRTPTHGDGRPHASAARSADHVRPEMRDLAATADLARATAGRAAQPGRAGPVRWRGRHACVAWGAGARGHGGPRARAWSLRSASALACRA